MIIGEQMKRLRQTSLALQSATFDFTLWHGNRWNLYSYSDETNFIVRLVVICWSIQIRILRHFHSFYLAFRFSFASSFCLHAERLSPIMMYSLSHSCFDVISLPSARAATVNPVTSCQIVSQRLSSANFTWDVNMHHWKTSEKALLCNWMTSAYSLRFSFLLYSLCSQGSHRTRSYSIQTSGHRYLHSLDRFRHISHTVWVTFSWWCKWESQAKIMEASLCFSLLTLKSATCKRFKLC